MSVFTVYYVDFSRIYRLYFFGMKILSILLTINLVINYFLF